MWAGIRAVVSGLMCDMWACLERGTRLFVVIRTIQGGSLELDLGFRV